MTTTSTNNDDKKPEGTFEFIVRRALEPDDHPDNAKYTAIQTNELREEKRKWKEDCRRKNKEDDLIERYCYDIRGESPEYESTFEEMIKIRRAGDQAARMSEKFYETAGQRSLIRNKPEGMTTKQWINEKRRQKLLLKEQMKQEQLDSDLESSKNPLSLFVNRLEKVGCRCKAEQMRRGIVCDTCRLIVKVHEYTLDLFNRASQGRTSHS
jgi:hypothetical protein